MTAVVFRGSAALGRYVVQNLSAGGALLTGRRRPDPEEAVQVMLPFPGRDAVVIEGTVVRVAPAPNDLAAVAIRFEHDSPVTEDAIQQALLEVIVAEDRRDRPAVLVVEDCGVVCDQIANSLRSMGRRVVTASTPLDAVHCLEDPEENIDTAMVDVSVGEADGLELVTFIREEHPDVRRVLVQGAVRPSAVELMRASEFVHAVLADRWDEADLARAIEA